MTRKKTKIQNPSDGENAVTPWSSQIAEMAYRLWIERGCPSGSPEEDWFRAEKELSAQVEVSKALSKAV
jgi:hypothetical protein